MPKSLHAAVRFPLPDDVFDQAELLAKIRPHWKAFVDGVTESGATNLEHELMISETKAPQKKAANGTPRQPRQPRNPATTTATSTVQGALLTENPAEATVS